MELLHIGNEIVDLGRKSGPGDRKWTSCGCIFESSSDFGSKVPQVVLPKRAFWSLGDRFLMTCLMFLLDDLLDVFFVD